MKIAIILHGDPSKEDCLAPKSPSLSKQVRGLMNLNAIILCRLFYIRECRIPILTENSLNLIKARKRVPDVACVGQRLLTLLWKGEDTVGQIALPSEFPVFGAGLPCGLNGHGCTPCGIDNTVPGKVAHQVLTSVPKFTKSQAKNFA
jgi:hypothetical protein